MFGSASFLSSYLPQYFINQFSQINSASPRLNFQIINHQTDFLKMTAQLFEVQKSQLSFEQFLQKTFLKLAKEIQTNFPLDIGSTQQNDFIAKQFGQVNQLTIQLVTELVYMNTYIRSKKYQDFDMNNKISLSIARIISLLQKLRFQCEIHNQSLQNDCQSLQISDILYEIIKSWASKWFIQEDCIKAVQEIMEDECSNLLSQVKDKIQDQLTKNSNKMNQENPQKVEEKSSKIKEHMLQRSQSTYDIAKNNSFLKNYDLSIQKKAKSFDQKSTVSSKNSAQRNSDALKRIQEYAKLKKSKIIAKNQRTVHQSRKCTYASKINQSFYSFNSFEKQQQSTQNSIDFAKSASLYNNSSNSRVHYEKQEQSAEHEDQNCLVLSTPKPAKFKPVVTTIISKKLFFS